VDYRPADVALAPAALEDCLCALKWVYHNARQYGFDTKQIVVTGASAGGHLSLTTGMTPPSAGLSGPCTTADVLTPIEGAVTVAAIVNWFGITDVADIAQGENEKSYAVMWLGSQPSRMAVAKQTSPLTYVRAGLPPILTIHGDRDPVVPYTHATRLQAALSKLGVTNQLVTIPGGGHGNFSPQEMRDAFAAVFAFLAQAGIKPEG
jgi:acetyl esterase/lipase